MKPIKKVILYRKNLRNMSIKNVDITSRQKAFDEAYKKELGPIAKILKSKSIELDVHTDESLDKMLKK